MKTPMIESFGITDIGTRRTNNEDVIATLPSHGFYAIADGIGGHNAGEIAAKVAIDELIASISHHFDPERSQWLTQKEIIFKLAEAINKANQRVYNLSIQNHELKGMGTTICCLYLNKESITYAHVGDSRLYLYRNKTLRQLTKDHSLITDLGSHETKNRLLFPYKNIITRAIGTNHIIEPTINFEKTSPNDIYFLCTDGLSDYISNDDITHIIKYSENKELTVKKLIEAAKNYGSKDNISAILIEIKDNR